MRAAGGTFGGQSLSEPLLHKEITLHHSALCARQRPKVRKMRPLSDLVTRFWGPGAGCKGPPVWEAGPR